MSKRNFFASAVIAAIFLLFFLFVQRMGKDGGSTQENVSQPHKLTLAVSTIGATHGWASDVLACAEKKLDEVARRNGWNSVCMVGADAQEQSRQVNELVEQGVDCIIMLPMDGASLKTAAIAVKRANIPLVIFDREIPEFAPTATVKGDNEGIGRESARYMNLLFPKGTTALEVMGDTSTVPFYRTYGFDRALNENITKIQVGYTEWQRDVSRKVFRDWVSSQDDELLASVGAIYTHDDEIALGVLEELDEMERQGELDQKFPALKVISGSSSSQEMYKRIQEEDRFDLFSMTYLPQMMERAIETGEAILRQEKYSEMTIVPTVKIDKNNVEQYLGAVE